MAKLNGPLLSVAASGSLGPRLTFSTRTSGAQVRYQRSQKDVITDARTTQRGFFQLTVNWWNELSPAEKSEWKWEGDNP